MAEKTIENQLPKIYVNHGDKGKLKDFFEVSFGTVQKALDGGRCNPTAIKIREKAIEMGGITSEKIN